MIYFTKHYMKIAFDLDGTCWEHRELFSAIIKGLRDQGHMVGILTAHNETLEKPDLALWKARGFPDVNFYIAKTTECRDIPSFDWKMSMCKGESIDFLFDDFDTGDIKLIKITK